MSHVDDGQYPPHEWSKRTNSRTDACRIRGGPPTTAARSRAALAAQDVREGPLLAHRLVERAVRHAPAVGGADPGVRAFLRRRRGRMAGLLAAGKRAHQRGRSRRAPALGEAAARTTVGV